MKEQKKKNKHELRGGGLKLPISHTSCGAEAL